LFYCIHFVIYLKLRVNRRTFTSWRTLIVK